MRALVAACALASCAAADLTPAPDAAAKPARVILYEDTVTVETTDRALCVGPRDGRGRAWSGTLQGCPHPWPYRATLPPYRVARLPLLSGAGGAGAVEIVRPDGTEIFSGAR